MIRRPDARQRIPGITLIALLVPMVAMACGGDSRERVTVLAASSLTSVFEDIEATFEAEHADVDLVISTGGSPSLAAQAAEGSPADLLITADDASMRRAVDAGVVIGDPQAIATNTVVAAAAAEADGAIQTLEDLGAEDLLLSLCAPEVPCGAAALDLLETAGVDATADSLESSVQGVVTRLVLGEVDVGIVYETDVSASDGALRVLDADVDELVGHVRYDAALLTDGSTAAGDLLDFLTSADARRLLRQHGFGDP